MEPCPSMGVPPDSWLICECCSGLVSALVKAFPSQVTQHISYTTGVPIPVASKTSWVMLHSFDVVDINLLQHYYTQPVIRQGRYKPAVL